MKQHRDAHRSTILSCIGVTIVVAITTTASAQVPSHEKLPSIVPPTSVRFGDETLESTIQTTQRSGQDGLFQGPQGWVDWNYFEAPKPFQNPMLILRNNSNRKERPDDIKKPGKGEAVTGPFFPEGYTTTKEEFEAKSETPKPTSVAMTTGQGKKMILTMQTLKKSRGYLYCELVFNYGEKGNDIYSTSPLAEAKLAWWNSLDLKALAKEFGAKSVYKNGPQWWSMDEVGVMASKPVKVAGVDMVFGAHLPPNTLNIPKYTVFNPAKFQNLAWKAGKPVYQLVDADGNIYVLQGHKVPASELATLGKKFKKLPKGWEYRVKGFDEDLVMKLTPNKPIPSVQDEFDQIYIRIPVKGK